jgi:DNA polymerase elongation subunit (family B)
VLQDKNKKPVKEQGDPVIQIGTVFHNYRTGDRNKVILVKGPTDDTPENEICDSLEEYSIKVIRCESEAKMLIEWSKLLRKEDPDFITGYNIFGFDFTYLYERAKVCFPCKKGCNPRYNKHSSSCIMRQFLNMGIMDSTDSDATKHSGKLCKYIAKDLNSSALGENALGYFQMDGRVLFDIQKEVQKSHSLESYKLDNVAAHFMRGKVKEISDNLIYTELKTLKVGDYVSFRTHCNIGEQLYNNGEKYQITEIYKETNKIELSALLEIDLSQYHKVEWCLNKDDITPQDIFDKHQDTTQRGAKGRAEVAKYCIQDCELCIDLLLLLDLIPTNLAMANVSFVPVSYIFLRGQGVKVTSLVARQCNLLNVRMPDLRKMPLMRDYVRLLKNGESKKSVREAIIEDNSKFGKPKDWEVDEWMEEAMSIFTGDKGMEGYEGAIVLDPKPGIYLDDPVAVLDYASLYPSSIIEKNCSHETQIDESQLDNFNKEDYHKVEYENYEYVLKGKGNSVDKVLNTKQPKKTCYFIKPKFLQENGIKEDDARGIIPMALQHLLRARKDTKQKMKLEKDEFKYKVLDCEQLALKVTANSIYGQLGARTSPICKMELAASTTAIGREKIDIAKQGVMVWAEKKGYEPPDVVYGDTDSVFVKFSRVKDGKTLEGKEALAHCIECGKQAGDYITHGILKDDSTGETKTTPEDALLDDPQDLEYEKTFWPFILISKKRYTGDKYEFSADEIPKRTAMGIVLKRRDNAPIVKHIFGNVIEIIMIEKNFDKALKWMKHALLTIQGQDISKFVITKSLRGYYKNPEQIAHKVLADRMAERDPGNKPKANDRIPYAYIELPDEVLYDTENPYKSGPRKGKPRERAVKQGDRIEHVDYIKEHNKRLDYAFYITNQIMNPVKQVLDLNMDAKKTEEIFAEILQKLKSNNEV